MRNNGNRHPFRGAPVRRPALAGRLDSEGGYRPRGRSRGFTLLELMVVVIIIGIIAALAYPSYLDSVRKSRRSDARQALNDAAAREEQYFLDNHQYTTSMTALGYSADSSGNALSPEKYYDISATNLTTSTYYQLQAIPAPQSPQIQDTDCSGTQPSNTMTLDQTGIKNPPNCWN